MKHDIFLRDALDLVNQPLRHRPFTTDDHDVVNHIWVLNKCRIQRWNEQLFGMERTIRSAVEHHEGAWEKLKPDLMELFLADIYVASWSAWFHSGDVVTWRSNPGFESVFQDTRAAANRAARCVEAGFESSKTLKQPIQVVGQLCAFKKKCQQWNDVILGFVVGLSEVEHFAWSPAEAAAHQDTISLIRSQQNQPLSLLRREIWKKANLAIDALSPRSQVVSIGQKVHQAMVHACHNLTQSHCSAQTGTAVAQ